MMNNLDQWKQALTELPLIAILRGVQPQQCLDVADVLFDEGFRILEVPLNSPQPFDSISQITKAFPDQFTGAGTVTTLSGVEGCVSTGCRLIVTPNFNPAIAARVFDTGMIYCPGVATPSEAFAALEAGAHGLKLFPAELVGANVVKAIRAVLPPETSLIPVGGINPSNMAEFVAAGANGFGIGSALYKPGKSLDDIRMSARDFVSAWRDIG